MTKFFFSCYLLLFTILCQAQDVSITWKIKESCAAYATGDGLMGSPEMSKVKRREVELVIEIPKKEIKSIKFMLEDSSLGLVDKKDIIPESSDDAVKVKINASGEVKKMTIGENPRAMAYPYVFRLFFGEEDSCTLTIGNKLNVTNDDLDDIAPEINVLQGVIHSFEGTRFSTENFCEKMEGCNAIIVIDASVSFSAKSKIYRKNCCGKCKNNKCVHSGLWVRDYVKIYLDNFNQYRHNVTLDDRQIDAEFAITAAIFKQEQDKKKDDNKEAVSAGSGNEDGVQRLRNYADAVLQMKTYIDFVKSNTQPDSKILEYNKDTILKNLTGYELMGDDIGIIYNNLESTEKGQMKSTYDIAKDFLSVKSELRMLSYTLEATILPIMIKSFDKFEFTVTLNNKATKEVVSTRVYEYLIKGGLKVDQSFGIVFHSIRDQEYGFRSFMGKDTLFAKNSTGVILKKLGTNIDSIASITDTPKREIIQGESPDKLAFGASTFSHLYFRTGISNRIRVGIGPEVGISADIYPKTAVRYLVGGGILFYDGRHRVSLDIGCAFGKFSELGNGQKIKNEKESGTILSGVDTQPSLVEKTGKSMYFGVSYNTPLVRNDTQKN